MIRAHKIRLNPTPEQVNYFARAAGTSHFELGDHRIWVPKLGWVNMAENLRLRGKVTGARITKTADWWCGNPGGSP